MPSFQPWGHFMEQEELKVAPVVVHQAKFVAQKSNYGL